MLQQTFLNTQNIQLLHDLIIKFTQEEGLNTLDLKLIRFSQLLKQTMLNTLKNIRKEEIIVIPDLEGKIGFLNKQVLRQIIPNINEKLHKIKMEQRRSQIQSDRLSQQQKLAQFERPQVSNYKKDNQGDMSNQLKKLTQSRDLFDSNLTHKQNIIPIQPKNTSLFNNNTLIETKKTNSNLENPEILMEKLEKSRESELISQNQLSSPDKKSTSLNIQKQTIPIPNLDPMVKSMIDFQEKNEEFLDKDKEFEKRLKMLHTQREKNFVNTLKSTTDHKSNKSISPNPNSKNKIFSKGKTNKHDSIEELPKQTLKETIINQLTDDSQISQVLPSIPQVRQSFGSHQEQVKKRSITDDRGIISLPLNYNEEMNQRTLSKMILINSADRIWYGSWKKSQNGSDIFVKSINTNRYNFVIKFSHNQSENTISYIKEPIKSVVSIELSDVILSTHDNPSLISISSNDLTYGQVIEEVETEIVKEKSQLEKPCKFNRYIYYNIYTYPYLLMNIKEFSGNVLTSNKNCNDNMMGRLVIGKNYVNSSFCKNNDIVQGYILMKPLVTSNNSSIEFKPTPLAILDKITIQLLKPNGDVYGSENVWNQDNIGILGLELQEDQIKLYVDTPFHPSMYLCGDSINVKCLEFLVIDNDVVSIQKDLTQHQQKIKSFLDTQKSIYIKRTEYIPFDSLNFINTQQSACMCEFHNVIVIGMPLILEEHNDLSFICSSKGKWSAGGCLININIQPSYTFNITYNSPYLEKKSLTI